MKKNNLNMSQEELPADCINLIIIIEAFEDSLGIQDIRFELGNTIEKQIKAFKYIKQNWFAVSSFSFNPLEIKFTDSYGLPNSNTFVYNIKYNGFYYVEDTGKRKVVDGIPTIMNKFRIGLTG